MQTVSLSFFRFADLPGRLWAFAMMGLGRRALARTPGIGFWKLCGSGTGEGFTPIPNIGVYAILATWPDLETARTAVADAPLWQRYRARAVEAWTLFLSPVSSRGAWSGQAPFEPRATQAGTGPLAALTRATLRPRALLQFWKAQPDIGRAIGEDPSVIFKAGIGEVPLMRQITVSVWPDAAAMARFARTDGPHARAIRAVRDGDWFREELYARFRVVGEAGTWEGQSPRIPQEVTP
ncbi:spheroidene monooxygenase [Roseivivax marinus]|uniref:spheroidene monooxygenase n=1 Tax=Roseivivax marinus TaxID=1379903 RepID=UPI00273E70D8|nr:spheroidene monooxygenase [Roseivivax marinus]